MNNKFKGVVGSEGFKKALYVILAILAALFVFQLGMLLGFRKASFSDKIGGNYFREIRGRDDFLLGFRIGDFLSSHGAVGNIVGIKLPMIVVADNEGNEKTVEISAGTQIKFMDDIKTQKDLKIDDFVVVFGAPSDGDPIIEARLIRIMPPVENSIFE